MDKKQNRYHFIGIGGCGMSGIAKLLLQLGIEVSGSDIKESLTTDYLQSLGATISCPQQSKNIQGKPIVVISSAIQNNNPELLEAQRQGLTCLMRAEMLNELMKRHHHKISVAGTHGKTSTTAIVATLLREAKLDPTYLTGSPMKSTGANANLGAIDYFVTESDESDGSFLKLSPNISIITNIEPDHMDYYQSTENLIQHFTQFCQETIDRDGYLVLNRDDPKTQQIIKPEWESRYITFSITQNSDVRATDIQHNEEGIQFRLWVKQEDHGEVILRVFGLHNIYNTLAAIAVGVKENIPIKTIISGVQKFKGTQRRFEKYTQIDGISLYDDYAHHPTEIKITLEGAKESLKKPIICIFQPHRYSRTKQFLNEFSESFNDANTVIITEIYAANETQDHSISANDIVDKLKQQGKDAYYIPDKDAIPTFVHGKTSNNAIIITMGAGNISSILPEISQKLK